MYILNDRKLHGFGTSNLERKKKKKPTVNIPDNREAHLMNLIKNQRERIQRKALSASTNGSLMAV